MSGEMSGEGENAIGEQIYPDILSGRPGGIESDFDGVAIECCVSHRERTKERCFRGAKGDIDLPYATHSAANGTNGMSKIHPAGQLDRAKIQGKSNANEAQTSQK